MKKYIVFAASILLMSACNQKKLDSANMLNDSLSMVLNEREFALLEKDSALNNLISTFSEIERNLDSVAVKQQIIYAKSDIPGEMRMEPKEKINAQITAINELMDKNRKKIAALNAALRNSKNKSKTLQELVNTLNGQLVQKDQELADLNAKLVSLNIQVAQLITNVDTLTAEKQRANQSLTETTTALHAAYFVVGGKRELEKSNVIDSKGGLLGIGSTKNLNANADPSKFTQIDYTQTTAIPVNGHNVHLVTTHPLDSYTLERDGNNTKQVKSVLITDPDKFWRSSKYLVVMKD